MTPSDAFRFYKYDGASFTLLRVADVGSLVNFNGLAYYTYGSSGALWKTNGTDVSVKNFGSAANAPQWLTTVGPWLYFTADDGVNGRELWKSDGTASGTTLVKDVAAGANGSSPTNLTNVNGSQIGRAHV